MQEQLQLPTAIPSWLPPQVRARITGTRYQLPRLPEVVRRRMRTPERIGVAEHAEKYRMVTDGPHAGPWRHALAPHTIKIMETFSLPYVREIWFCGVDQSGKTNTMLNCMHWAIDIDPGDIYYAMPTEATANKVVAGKIIPMLKASKRLGKYVSTRADDTTMASINLTHGVTIRPAYANSPSSMATFSAKHCFGDEIDKFPERSGRETDPVTLIKKRNRQYRGRYKRFFASTPAQLFIYRHTMACVQVWEERHKCPHCGALFRPEAEGLVIPDGMSADDISEQTMIRYTCTSCGVELNDTERMRILADPHWHCVKGADELRPSRVGFLHRAWDCPDVPLHEIATYWLKAKNGGVAEKIAWANGIEAIDYVHEQQDRAEDYILRLVDEHLPKSIVPPDTQGLLVMADTQQRGFFYQVWAVGWGESLPVAIIEHGFVEDSAALVDIYAATYRSADGQEYRPLGAFIDSGGGTIPGRPKHSRTVEVYDFCRKYKMFRPLKGRAAMETAWNSKRLDFYPSSIGQKVPIPGGLTLYTINVNMYKDDLDIKLQHEPGSPGALRLHAGTTKDFARQLCAEYRDEHGKWQCPEGKPNHHWDICVYGMALADIMRMKRRRPAIIPPGDGKRKPSKGGGFVHGY